MTQGTVLNAVLLSLPSVLDAWCPVFGMRGLYGLCAMATIFKNKSSAVIANSLVCCVLHGNVYFVNQSAQLKKLHLDALFLL